MTGVNQATLPESTDLEANEQVCEAKTSTKHLSQALDVKLGTRDENAVPETAPSSHSHDIHDQTLRVSFPRLIAAYLCLCACYFTSYLDMNSVTTALPTISHSLNAGTTIIWTGTAYLLGQTSFQPLYGRMSDIFGRKPILLASVSCVVAGGLLCGFAQTPIWLYTSRALNGIGGGGISSLVAIIVSDLVSLKERGKYQGMISIAIGTGAMTGPFVAASLVRTAANGWRWVFWVPSLVASGCFVLLLFLLPQKPVTGNWKEKLRKIDWFGLGASVTGIVLLLIPVTSGGSIWPWRSALTISMLTVGGISLILFVFIEGYSAKIPIIPLRLFKQRSTAILFIQGTLHDFVWQATQYFLPLYFQNVRGYSPLESATIILPFLLAQSLAGAISGPVMSRLARYSPVLRSGFALWALGAGLNLLFSRTTSIAVYVVVLAIQGTGVGFVHQPGLVALQALSRSEDRAVATSTRNLLRSLGAVVGVAVSTATQYATTDAALRDKVPSSLLTRVLDGSWQIGEAGSEVFESDILDAKMKGFRLVFIMLVPLMGLCMLGSLFVADIVLKGDEEKHRKEQEGQPIYPDSNTPSTRDEEKRDEGSIPKGEVIRIR
ncbi:related to DHA14-like major facilitator efflux transporter (MFS transporter) [Phialocephala subalpina]|uniref:Related to DHA14-like major facilitator efflux transporter (MFS transporter) n=1 Tax=Phialocephala subalpina TaxID=576137 RepID=A0A1L7XMR1_9HELO|nr:related to DHA14-like major facilitator efflux transporter (MFS transporter) [Phialocephala subalpina]